MGVAGFFLSLTVGFSANLQNRQLLSPSKSRLSRPSPFWLIPDVILTFIAGLACLFGGLTSRQIARVDPNTHYVTIGSSVLIAIGCWVITQGFISTPSTHDKSMQSTVTNRILFAAMAAIMANMSLGLGVGFAQLHPVLTAASVVLSGIIQCFWSHSTRWFTMRSQSQRFAITLSGVLIVFAGLIR